VDGLGVDAAKAGLAAVEAPAGAGGLEVARAAVLESI
jgi:hypothetical protein